MFAFEIWGKFASFRDPFTISQNISLPIPPKSTVAGMMASILGVENYFDDSAFNEFEYSVIVLSPITKKSFSQNYINDYTSQMKIHLNDLIKGDIEKIATGLRKKKSPQKPINRELLLNPRYLIVVNNFQYEKTISEHLQQKISKFPFYLGNSEFAGNFRWVALKSMQKTQIDEVNVDSFILEQDLQHIEFQEGTRYSSISFATHLNTDRTPMNAVTVITGSKPIVLKNSEICQLELESRVYHCRFI